MNKQQVQKLKDKMSSFARINFYQYSDMGGNEPTGIFCSVNLEVKKTESLERIKQIIADLKLPFQVSESGLERTRHLIIKL